MSGALIMASHQNKMRVAALVIVSALTGCGGAGGAGLATAIAEIPQIPTTGGGVNPQAPNVITGSNNWSADAEYTGSRSGADSTNANWNAETAYNQDYFGEGQTIAILDAGYRRTHQELEGRIVGGIGSNRVDSHGTHVAAIAAGARDGQGMMGIAPGANLHLSSIYTATNGLTPTHWADATRDAASAGAVALNNSWRFDREVTIAEARAAMASAGSLEGALLALGANGRLYAQGGAADWRDFLTALRDFQDTGVIVKSVSNDIAGNLGAAGGVNLHAALPTLAPELQGAWLTVANVTRNGGSASLLSAPCAEAAAYCLSVNGSNVLSASAASDTGYQRMSGSSMAAPQVSGAVAILAEAFPDLTPAELAARLLATADNSFFTADGQTAFSGGVTHGYSDVYGHGTPDLDSALAPVGTLGVALTESATGPTAAVSSTSLNAGSAGGDALERALEGHSLVVFDALGAPFQVKASAFVAAPASARRELLTRLSLLGAYGGRAMLVEDEDGVALTAFQETRAPGAYLFIRQGRLGFDAGQADSLGDAAGFVVVTPDFTGVYGETGEAFAARASYDLTGGLSIGARSFTAKTGTGRLSGAGADLSLTRGAITLSLGLEGGGETNGVGGLNGSGAFDLGAGTRGAARLAAEWRFSDTAALYGAYVAGSAQAEGRLAGLEGGRLEAFTLGLRGSSLFTGGDRWSLSLSQPARLTGQLRLRTAEGRDASGAVQWTDRRVDLTPSGRELTLGARYDVPLSNRARLSLAGAWRRDANHVRGAEAFEAMALFQLRF